jgi:multiple sugar transport system substrate-binding protein
MDEKLRARLTRRSMLGLLGGTTGALALAACTPKEEPTAQAQPTEAPAAPTSAPEAPTEAAEPTEQAPPGETVRLRFYANADPSRNAWMTDVAFPAFQALHPEITMEAIIVPWDEFDPKLSSMFAAGDLPELWGNWGSTSYAEYVLRGMAVYEEDYIAVEAEALDLDDIPANVVEGLKIRGRLVGLPMYIMGTYCYTNKTLFDAEGLDYPPSDWDDASWTWGKMVEVAGRLTKNYDDPATGQYGVSYGGSPEEPPWLWGHSIWSEDALATSVAKEIDITNPLAIEAFQAWADLVCKHRVAPDATVNDALSAAGGPFQSGKLGMMCTGGWGFDTLRQIGDAFKWGAAALPRGPKGDLKDAIYADPILISAQTPHKEQAWEFLKYAYSVEGMHGYTAATAWPPSRLSLLADWADLWPEAVRQEFRQTLEGSWKYGEVTPWNRIAGYSQFWDIFWAELDPAFLCEKTMEEVLPIAKQKVEEVLAGLEF